MGDYTEYTLEVLEGDPALIAKLREENKDVHRAMTDDGRCFIETKWYRHHADMMEFSAKHPTALFRLHGDGDYPGDMWAKYFKNGKAHDCEVTIEYSEFDPEKLTYAYNGE